MKECEFCKLVYGYENTPRTTLFGTRNFLAFHADHPKNSGPLLIVFKKHASFLDTNEETADWMEAMKKAAEFLNKFLKNENNDYKYKVEMSYKNPSENSAHFHFYMTPVSKESLKNPCSGKCSLDVRNMTPPNCS